MRRDDDDDSRAKTMNRYRWLRGLATIFLIVEFTVGFGGALTPRQEIFPFASWFLFLLVPSRTSEYDVVLTAEGRRTLDPPPSFSHAPDALVQGSHSIVAYQLIQQLGDAERKNDRARSLAIRHQIEAHFRVPFIHYQLDAIQYHPVERWQSGRIAHRSPLVSYTEGQSEPDMQSANPRPGIVNPPTGE